MLNGRLPRIFTDVTAMMLIMIVTNLGNVKINVSNDDNHPQIHSLADW